MTAEQWTTKRIAEARAHLKRQRLYGESATDIYLRDALDTIDAQQRELQAARLVTDVFTEGYKAEVVEYNAEEGKVLLHLTYRQYQKLDNALNALRGEGSE